MEFTRAAALDILQRTPATLTALLAGIDESWSRGNEGADTFSPFDVIGHLIDGEETDWIPRARLILSRGPDVVFEPFDRFRHEQRNAERDLDSLLEEFAVLRAENLDVLRSWQLTDTDLDKVGRHPDFGSVALRHLLATWVVHDLGHVAQIARVLAKQYAIEVGPWAPYVPVLSDRRRV